VLLASTDVRRPAAMLQLERLAAQVHAEYFSAPPGATPAQIARAALEQARSGVFDVLIVDTAGRLHVDEELMAEVRDIDAVVGAAERLFVVDSMAGQDAVNAARAFGTALDLTGIILTKADGDARGGAALSVREVTGKPIVFIGVGEKTEALEPFDPERMASRILGMGDVLSLVEEARRSVDLEEAEKLAKKVKAGKAFDLEDFKAQMQQMSKMGGLGALVDKLPAQLGQLAQGANIDERVIKRTIGIINSMTPAERARPELIKASRKRRVASGAGVSVQEVNRLLNQFEQMQKMMKMISKGGMQKMMRSMRGMLPGMR
jgi:signal recognition particle subunit SRP54